MCSLLSTCSTWPNAITFATRDRAVTKLNSGDRGAQSKPETLLSLQLHATKVSSLQRDITLLTEPPPFVIFPKFESAAGTNGDFAICSESVLQLLLAEMNFSFNLLLHPLTSDYFVRRILFSFREDFIITRRLTQRPTTNNVQYDHQDFKGWVDFWIDFSELGVLSEATASNLAAADFSDQPAHVRCQSREKFAGGHIRF